MCVIVFPPAPFYFYFVLIFRLNKTQSHFFQPCSVYRLLQNFCAFNLISPFFFIQTLPAVKRIVDGMWWRLWKEKISKYQMGFSSSHSAYRKSLGDNRTLSVLSSNTFCIPRALHIPLQLPITSLKTKFLVWCFLSEIIGGVIWKVQIDKFL